MSIEEIRGVTWDLWGEELSHEQTIQRIVNAGFPVAGGVALTMFAIVEGESGEYQRAWHANVQRNAEGKISRFSSQGTPLPAGTYMKVRSIDLGFMQVNVPTADASGNARLVEMTEDAMLAFCEEMFDSHPDLADPVSSCERALKLYKERGFQPWYAYKPGTIEFWRKKRYGALALARWHLHAFVGWKDRETGEPLDLEWK